MKNSFSQKYDFTKIFAFVLPNIVMQIFLSLYVIIDGVFVSRYVGSIALGSVNIVYPLICLEMAVGIMLATGGSAIVAFHMGANNRQKALESFSLLTIVTAIIGVLMAIGGNVFMPQLVAYLGASALQFDMCVIYGRILIAFAPAFLLQILFQTFFVTAGLPVLGLMITIAAGATNIVFDYIFMDIYGMGIDGAAWATCMSYTIPSLIGIIYFYLCRSGSLHFVKPRWDGDMLLKSCSNGSSEMVTNLANAITTFLFNYIFMKFYGEDGVASISIVLYFQFIFSALYLGYSIGVSPIISYKHGAGDKAQLKKIVRTSLMFLSGISIVICVFSIATISPILMLFTPSDTNLFKITQDGFPYYAVSFAFMGVSIFASALFTALSDGVISAIISFGRTLVFLVGALFILPYFLGEIGVWLAVPVAELLGIILAALCLMKKSSKYGY